MKEQVIGAKTVDIFLNLVHKCTISAAKFMLQQFSQVNLPPTSAQRALSACLRSPAAWLYASPLEAWRSHPGDVIKKKSLKFDCL